MVRHARHRGGIHAAVLVIAALSGVSMTLGLIAMVPAFRPAEQLGLDVVTAVGGPLAQRLDGVASRSTDRQDAVGVGIVVTPAAPARAGSLPTWRGGGADDAGTGTPGQEGGVTAGPTTTPGTNTGAEPMVTVATSVSAAMTGEPAPTASSPSAAPTATATTSASATGSPAVPDERQRMLDLTNAERVKVGCPALTVDVRLATSADAHASDMVARQYFDHSGPDGSTPTTRGAAAGYPGGVAENIGAGFTDAGAVMAEWMASAGHRANIVDCTYKVIGIGYDPGKSASTLGVGTWVQTFGSV